MKIKFGDNSLNLKVDGSLANIDRGPRGYSAYEIAVQEGFVGTEEEWLASLVGPEGKQGKDGERGIQGPRGQQGDKGDKGDIGPQGDKGDRGDTGPQGVKGDRGDIGPQGEKGDIGPSNVLSIGSVTKGDEANATITGESPNQILNLVLPKGDKGEQGEQGVQGIQGVKGDTGEPFTIKKTYSSVAEMNADFYNMQYGDYVMIASSVEVEDNAKLYTRGQNQWIYITDFSGATGIKGEKGDKGEQGVQGIQGIQGIQGETGEKGDTGNGILSIQKTATAGLVDTYTITFTDGTTTTFDVTNGEDGEVTQAQLDESQAKQDTKIDWLQTLVNQMPTVSGQGTDLSLQDVLNYRLMKFLPQGVSSQDGEPTPTTPVPVKSVTGENSVKVQNRNLFDNVNEITANIGLTSGGGTFSSTDYCIKNWLKLKPNTNYVLSDDDNTKTKRICFYTSKSESSFISVVEQINKTVSFTTPANCKYVRIQIKQTELNNEMLVKGSTAPSTYVEHEEQNYQIYLGGNVFELSKATENAYINTDGTIGTSSASNLSGYIPVIGGLTYNLTYDYETLLSQGKRGYCFYDNNQNYLSGTLYSSTNKTRQITIPTNARYFRFAYDKNCTNISLATDMTPIELNSSPDGKIRDQIVGSSDVSYNLFDGARKNVYFNNQKQFASGIADALTTNYIPASEGDIFTISTELASDGIVIASFDKNKVCISRSAVGTSSLSLTYTCPANTKYIIGSNFIGMTTNTTLVEGSEVKPYFPYGQVGMWYKREYIKKVTITSDDVREVSNTYSDLIYYRILKTSDCISYNSYTEDNAILGNKFIATNMYYFSDSRNIGKLLSKAHKTEYWIGFDIGTTLEQAKELLNNAYYYYVTTNPIDIPITNTTLINQLNDIYNNAHSYNGVTNITTTYEDGNEQMYLDVEALAKGGSTTAETDPIFSASASSGITSSDITNWNGKASTTYVDTAIANAITNTLGGSY